MSENDAVADSPPAVGARPISAAELRFYAVCRFIAVGASRVWFPGRVIGAEHLPVTGPYILAPVHRSNVDWLVVARVTTRRLRYLVKGEVWKVKSVGRLLELLGTFPVHRGAADRDALNRSLEVLAAGEPLVVFPEGTRGSGPVVGELREGAAYLALRAGVPVLPVGVSGLERSMPRGAKFPRPVRVRIVVGAPVVPDEVVPRAGGRARVPRSATRAFNDRVRQAVQAAFDAAQARSAAGPERPGPAASPGGTSSQ
ncbi:MAG TPA: lysophospholipid acyltransferase family protein [Acidimicrobiales bacterium]|nr:lysophospholipid acyltransferase family protein [Acidimicrobiales bacterium]